VFPDGPLEIANVIVGGEAAVVDGIPTGRGQAPWGPALNGHRFRRRGCAVIEVDRGKIVRCRDYFDRANTYAPLGLIHLLVP
jgi:ketosteroid isomerase-like protein